MTSDSIKHSNYLHFSSMKTDYTQAHATHCLKWDFVFQQEIRTKQHWRVKTDTAQMFACSPLSNEHEFSDHFDLFGLRTCPPSPSSSLDSEARRSSAWGWRFFSVASRSWRTLSAATGRPSASITIGFKTPWLNRRRSSRWRRIAAARLTWFLDRLHWSISLLRTSAVLHSCRSGDFHAVSYWPDRSPDPNWNENVECRIRNERVRRSLLVIVAITLVHLRIGFVRIAGILFQRIILSGVVETVVVEETRSVAVARVFDESINWNEIRGVWFFFFASSIVSPFSLQRTKSNFAAKVFKSVFGLVIRRINLNRDEKRIRRLRSDRRPTCSVIFVLRSANEALRRSTVVKSVVERICESLDSIDTSRWEVEERERACLWHFSLPERNDVDRLEEKFVFLTSTLLKRWSRKRKMTLIASIFFPLCSSLFGSSSETAGESNSSKHVVGIFVRRLMMWLKSRSKSVERVCAARRAFYLYNSNCLSSFGP